MSKKQRELVKRPPNTSEAHSIQVAIENVRDALDRFSVSYEDGYDMSSAVADLLAWVGDLEDAVDKIKAGKDTKDA